MEEVTAELRVSRLEKSNRRGAFQAEGGARGQALRWAWAWVLAAQKVAGWLGRGGSVR